MYRFVFLFVLNAAASAAPAPNDIQCPCELAVKDRENLWGFLKKISLDVPDENKEFYSALPGQLSPTLDCDCEEYNRKKRKVVEVPEVIDDEINQTGAEETREKKSLYFINHGVGSCPENTVAIHGLCVERIEELDY